MRISENFTLEEFACPHCGEVSVDVRLLAAVQAIRSQLNEPVRILSGFRCATHNQAVGGASDSRHLIGQAADIGCEDFEKALALARGLSTVNGIGIDRERGMLHIDVRKEPRVQWLYVNGKAQAPFAVGRTQQPQDETYALLSLNKL